MVTTHANCLSSLPATSRGIPVARCLWRTAAGGSLFLAMGIIIACSPLEPMVEPEVSDLQLTADTLKTSLKEAQRTIAELRAEVESRRQEFADLQIARAQLEGRLREAERRLIEARHVIELQREELAGSRSERERVAKSGAMLRSQLKQLQLQLSKSGKRASEARGMGMASASLPAPNGLQAERPTTMFEESISVEETVGVAVTPAIHRRVGAAPAGVGGARSAVDNSARVSVRPGDTLWSITQRHHLSVKRLMAFNHLTDSSIQVGQALWLIEPPAADGSGAENAD